MLITALLGIMDTPTLNQHLIQVAQQLHTALVQMGHAKRASDPELERMLRIIACILAALNAVEEGPTTDLAGASKGLANAYQQVRDAAAPTPEQLKRLFDEWRHEAKPNRADVEALLEACREAEPNKTWEQLPGDRFKSTMKCPGGMCNSNISEDIFKAVLGPNGSWERFLVEGSGTMGWQYICNGKTHEACVDCVSPMAKEAFDGIKQQIGRTKILADPDCPQDKITRIAQFLREKYPAADRLFATRLVRGAWPGMTKARAAELELHEDAARPERKRNSEDTAESAAKRTRSHDGAR